MIREVLPEAVALVVFALSGALYGVITLYALSYDLKGIKKAVFSLLLGLLFGALFIVVSEVFYASVVTPYTVFCYALGYICTLVLEDEKSSKKRNKKPDCKHFITKLKPKIKRKKKTPKDELVISG